MSSLVAKQRPGLNKTSLGYGNVLEVGDTIVTLDENDEFVRLQVLEISPDQKEARVKGHGWLSLPDSVMVEIDA